MRRMIIMVLVTMGLAACFEGEGTQASPVQSEGAAATSQQTNLEHISDFYTEAAEGENRLRPMTDDRDRAYMPLTVGRAEVTFRREQIKVFTSATGPAETRLKECLMTQPDYGNTRFEYFLFDDDCDGTVDRVEHLRDKSIIFDKPVSDQYQRWYEAGLALYAQALPVFVWQLKQSHKAVAQRLKEGKSIDHAEVKQKYDKLNRQLQNGEIGVDSRGVEPYRAALHGEYEGEESEISLAYRMLGDDTFQVFIKHLDSHWLLSDPANDGNVFVEKTMSSSKDYEGRISLKPYEEDPAYEKAWTDQLFNLFGTFAEIEKQYRNRTLRDSS